MNGLLDTFNNPMMGLAAGLLSANRPGGSFGGGLSAGLQSMNAMQRGQQQRQLTQMQLEELRRQQAERDQQQQAFQGLLGQQGQFTNIAPGSPEEFAAFDQPNYAGDFTGGVRMDQAPSGLFAQNPQMAQMMQALGPEAGSQLMAKAYLQGMDQDQDSKSLEIERLQRNLGVDNATATGIAYGTLKTTQPDPQGNVGIIDLANNRIVGSFNIAQRPTQPTPDNQGMPQSSALMGAAEKGTGPGSALKSAVNNVVGWAVEGVPFQDEAKARQQLREFNQFVIQSLVNNPRAPVAEQQNIKAFQPDPDKFFKDPDEAKLQIQSLYRFLDQKKRGYQSTLQREDLPLDERSKIQSQLAGVDRVLQMMERKAPTDAKRNLSEKYNVELE